jgi:hypothetical protein
MKTIVIGAAASSTFPPLRGLQGLPAVLGDQKEALKQWLLEFVLELLAAIVLIAIFIAVTDPVTRGNR